MPAEAVEKNGGNNQDRGNKDKLGVSALRKISVEPIEHGVEFRVGRDGNKEHNDRPKEGIDHHTCEQYGGRFHAHLSGAYGHE